MSLLKHKIHFDPNASITKLPKIDPHGLHKLTKEETEGIEELAEKFPDLLSFMKHLNRGGCDLVDAINKAIIFKSFKDFRYCIRLYKSETQFNILDKKYPNYYIFYFNKVYKDHVSNVFNHLNIRDKEEKKKFFIKSYVTEKKINKQSEINRQRRDFWGKCDRREIEKIEEDIKKEKTPNEYFKKYITY